MNKTSILADTLADIKEIKEGIEKNANHVLKSTLKEDLEAIVRKGLNESEEDDDSHESEETETEPTDDIAGDIPADQGSEDGEDTEVTTGDAGDLEIDPTAEPEVIDLTDKSDDEVIQHFSLMKPADEIEVIQTPDGGVQINIKGAQSGGGGEEMGGLPGEETPGDEFTDEPAPEETPGDESGEETGEETETGEDDDENKPVYEITDTLQGSKEELHESLVKTRMKVQGLMTENKNKTKELAEMTALVKGFKTQESEYKSAIKNLKGELMEVALFTSNLSYIVNLISENSTTKDEKLSIIKRFDNAKTLNESREIFNSLESLLNENKKTAKETIDEQVLKTPKTSGSSNLNESTAYKSPQITRMLDIIHKIK